MAECVASPFCGKLHLLQRRPVRESGFSYQPTNFKIVHRKHSRNQCQVVHFSAWKTFEPSLYGAMDFKIRGHLRATSLKCIGLGSLAGTSASDLVPAVDQMLLMGSIFLTYMAGVIPAEESFTNFDKKFFSESSDLSVSPDKKNYQLELKYALNVVRGKLLNSLNALEHEAYSGDIIHQSAKQTLSLNAVYEGPKLRLLWAAFQKVEEEAGTVFIFSFSILA